MDKWWDEEKISRPQFAGNDSTAREIRILDLAAGRYVSRISSSLILTIPSLSGEATICLQEWRAIRTGKLTQVSTPGMSSATEPIASSHPSLPNPLAALRGNSGVYNASRPAFVPPSRRPAATNSGVKGDPVTEKKIDRNIPELRITATDPVSRLWFSHSDEN